MPTAREISETPCSKSLPYRCAVIARHGFEIDLDDASMEHGARTELRELLPSHAAAVNHRC
jgi:hypothetical protein